MAILSSTPTRPTVIASSPTPDRVRGYLSGALSFARTSHAGERNSIDVPREPPAQPLQRIAMTRRSDRETTHQSPTGGQAMIQPLLHHWGADFERRMAEPQPGPLPQFKAKTEVAVAVHETPIVFVVDDDVSVRESLELLVGSAGWQSEIFESAQEFLSRPRVLRPSCLVLDVTLPDLNGLELQKRVAVERPDMPIIFITGHGDVPMTVQAMKGGALEFLTKPFADHVLLNAIGQALELSRVALGDRAEVRELRDRYASLSQREREVMALVVRGLLNKQVGAQLASARLP